MQAGEQYWNKRLETVSTQEFHEVQERTLLKELDYVWSQSGFYQEKFQRAGITRRQITGLEEKLVFRAQVDLVPAGTLPKYEYKAQLVKVVGDVK